MGNLVKLIYNRESLREMMDFSYLAVRSNLNTVIFFIIFLSSHIILCDAFSARRTQQSNDTINTRRRWLSEASAKVISAAGIVAISPPTDAIAADEEYNNPNIPAGPEERCKSIICC